MAPGAIRLLATSPQPVALVRQEEDFQYFVDYMHQQGIGVLLDWVPSHFPKDGHSLSYFDGTHLYEYAEIRVKVNTNGGAPMSLIMDAARYAIS